ncbi:Uncharacterized protein dnm_042380 [Desulfonema magnum]|uniref:Uncharacterized protein n=1 Tax=Desulfonema magnum TaxID=45655 RepID=A0A975GNW5_9BACT|nr:Uncharacterized protein dnm_042380 [Desulfonema magnum]
MMYATNMPPRRGFTGIPKIRYNQKFFDPVRIKSLSFLRKQE